MMARAATTPGLMQVFSLFEVSTPQLYLDIDRTKAQLLGINLPDVFNTLQINIGSSYVNDFNLFGRTFRVQAQADSQYRLQPRDILDLRVRNSSGETVPFGCLHDRPRHFRTRTGCRATTSIRRPNSMARRRRAIRRDRRSTSWRS